MTRKSKPSPKPQRPREHPLELLSSYSRLFIGYFFVFTFVVGWFEIPSSSMENTLLIGDHVFVDRITIAPTTKWAPFVHYRPIRHGDIIVFLSPQTPGLYVVKRVMGIPGDHLHLRGGVVYRNGEALKEPYVIHSKDDYVPYRDNFPSVPASEANADVSAGWPAMVGIMKQGDDLVVPPDSYFGMGDNRDVSYDSRYWGFIPKENIIGRPLFVYWSFNTPEDQWKQTEISERAKFIGHVIIHFFDQTRWGRMFHLVR